VDTKEIKQIIELMEKFDLSEFDIEREGLKLRMKRGAAEQAVHHHPMPMHFAMPPQGYAQAPAQAAPQASSSAPEALDASIQFIKSPMVGTFYSASSPDAPALVKVGDQLSSNSTVCIIEAMKVMNEIHAEISGTVVEVLVQNGQSVEYGQALFKIKAA
jgi:acetyl-CoA carboxylase biotin carboxyl carrier protein